MSRGIVTELMALCDRYEAMHDVDPGAMTPEELRASIKGILEVKPEDFTPEPESEHIITGGGDGAVTRGVVTIVAKTDLVNGGYLYDWTTEGVLPPLEVASMLLGLGNSMLGACSSIAFDVQLPRYRPGDTDPQ